MDYILITYTKITPVKQSKYYYCGPATVVQSLIGMKVYSTNLGVSQYNELQSIFARDYLYTDENLETDLPDMVNTLNGFVSSNEYAYDWISASESKYSLISKVGNSLCYNRPVIMNPNTQYLNYYNDESIGHYISIESINSNTGDIVVVDCNYNNNRFGRRTVTYSQFRNAINGKRLAYGIV